MAKRSTQIRYTVPDYKGLLRQLEHNSDMAQCYQALLSNLDLVNTPRSQKAVLVTSTQPEEGKTMVTLSLALALTLARKKVVVVDIDLRKPHIHELCKLNNPVGIADVVAGNRGISDVIQTVEFESNGARMTLAVIGAGKTTPDFFNPTPDIKLRGELEYLRNIYDVVVIDSPPALAASDALMVGRMVDGIIFVVRSGAVTEREAKLAKDRIEQAGGHLLGVVMNDFIPARHGPEFHPYRHYYDQGR
jgi:capsular exopolysaccharide synthesis family protein